MQTEDQGAAISAEEFVRLVQIKDPRDWSGSRISGAVDLTGVTIAHPVVVRNAVFTDVVNWSQARLTHGADFSGCRFENKLILSDARIEGPLRLDHAVIGAGTEPMRDIRMIRLILGRLERSPDKKLRWQERLAEEEGRRAGFGAAADFENLRVAGCLSLTRATVFGDLPLDHAEIDCGLCIAGTLVHGSLSLRHASLGEFRTFGPASAAGETTPSRIDGGLDLTSSVISGDLLLIGVTIGGELNLQATSIEGNLTCRAGKGLRTRLRSGASLMTARVRGDADFSGARVDGEFDLGTSQIGGHLRCTRAGKRRFSLTGALDMVSARIENNAIFTRSRLKGNADLAGARIGAHASFEGALVEGDISFENASIGGALLLRAAADAARKPCEIRGRAWLLGIKVASGIDIGGLRLAGDLVLQNAIVGQNFLARARGGFPSHLGGHVYLNGARIHGAAEISGATLLGKLSLEGASIDDNFIVSFDLIYDDEPHIIRSHIHGGLQASSATIGKSVIFMGLSVGPIDRAAGSPPLDEPALSLVGAQINGELSLYSEGRFWDLLELRRDDPDLPSPSQEQEKRLSDQACGERTSILGDLRLNRAQVMGGILLDGVTIEGELDLRDANVRANITCRPIEVEGQNNPVRASASKADLEALDMTGNIHLTGLTVRGSREDGSDGDLNLRDSRVRGLLELYPLEQDLAEDREASRITIIRGSLRLDAAEISHVVLSGRTLDNDVRERRKLSWRDRLRAAWNRDGSRILYLLGGGQTEEETPVRVGLERATLGRLQIVKPLPGTVDLSNLKVDRWDLPREPSSYRDMLENSHPFKRSNYLSIESALRNAGEDAQADEVHTWMRRRDRRSTKNFWKVLFDVFLDLSIRYGTTSKRLVYLMILLFSISVFVFSNRQHVEYEISPSAGKPPPVEHPSLWSPEEAGLFAAQLHVPIISLGVKENVRPSGMGMRAYAMAVVAASWIMWPLLIASMSGLIRKRN